MLNKLEICIAFLLLGFLLLLSLEDTLITKTGHTFHTKRDKTAMSDSDME